MGPERSTSRLAQLWQFPLLLLSLGLFGGAAYLLVNPEKGPTHGAQLEAARSLLRQERTDAAIERLNALLAEEKVERTIEGAARMLLGEALEVGQRQRRLNIPANHQRIIEQTRAAMELGIEADAGAHRRLAESFDAIGRAGDAIVHYQKAMGLDEKLSLKCQRRVVEIQLRHRMPDAAGSIEEYLKRTDLADSERGWAVGEKAHVLIDRRQYAEARKLLEEALKLNAHDPMEQGQFNYWLGYCAWKLNGLEEAERYLRVARDQLRVQHPLDADAAYVLGRVRQAQKDWAGASSFYAAVLQSHLDSPVATLARLGRGVCRIGMGSEEAGLGDLSDVVKFLREKETPPAGMREEAISALQQGAQLLSNSNNYNGALELMAYEQELVPAPPGDFFARLGRVYERRAEQVQKGIAEGKGGEQTELSRKVREFRAKAGDAYIAFSRALIRNDDKGYGIAMWKGIELYDAAADLARSIAALETFVSERPNDPLTPDALLKLGGSYHAAGLFDKAIGAYRQCQFKYEKSLASSKAGVPLARAYIAKGPDSYRKAEEVLRAVVENNPQITPDAVEFREALLELAQLYYRTARYEAAVARLEELTQRYPEDTRKGQLWFLMADSYRKSGMLLDDRIKANAPATTRPALDMQQAAAARADRLRRARDLYHQVIVYFRNNPGAAIEMDRLYLKLSHFYRADCTYELGEYLEAIKLYDDAAFQYQDDPSALAAYVQIVNANVALGRIEEAKAANERAKWMLRRMPREVFESGGLMAKQSWEEWLRWSGETGMWK